MAVKCSYKFILNCKLLLKFLNLIIWCIEFNLSLKITLQSGVLCLKQIMIKKLFPSKSLLNINHKNFSQKPFCILTWSDSIVLLFSQKPCICNLCNHLYRSVRFKRTLTEKHVEKYDTD